MTNDSVPQKRCLKCGNEYPVSSEYFTKDKSRKDGLYVYCKNCVRERGRKYLENPVNLEHMRESGRVRRANPEYRATENEYTRRKMREYRKDPLCAEILRERVRQRRLNPEAREHDKQVTAAKRHTPEGREIIRIKSSHDRAKRKGAQGEYTKLDIDIQKQSQTDSHGHLRCWWCGKVIKNDYHIDHRIALARGGTNWPNNLCIACPHCNLSKHDKLPCEWIGRLI